LLQFRDDHLRHVEDFNRILRARGGTPLDRNAAPDGHLLRSLAQLTGPFGPAALVLAMVANEQLTNGSYDLALELEWDDDIMAVLERAFSDEQRHLSWLLKQQEKLAAKAGEEDAAPAPA
jgi:rubrerythrin